MKILDDIDLALNNINLRLLEKPKDFTKSDIGKQLRKVLYNTSNIDTKELTDEQLLDVDTVIDDVDELVRNIPNLTKTLIQKQLDKIIDSLEEKFVPVDVPVEEKAPKKNGKVFYGYAATCDVDDNRQNKWKKQRKKRGFDDTELWNLDVTIAQFILPRMKAFVKDKKKNISYGKRYFKELDKIIAAFTILSDDMRLIPSDEENAVIQKGLKLFANHYRGLWN